MSSRFNVDDREIKFMSDFADEWWNRNGTWKVLHDMNEIRINFVIEGLINRGVIESQNSKSSNALSGLKFLDAGYGIYE